MSLSSKTKARILSSIANKKEADELIGAVDALLNQEGVETAAPGQVRFVSKDGNDATATGAEDKPFKTVKAAQDSIKDASASKQYHIMIGPGIFLESNTWSPVQNVALIGSGNPGVTQAAATAAGTLIQRQNASAIPVLLSNGASVANRLMLMDLRIDGGIQAAKAAGDVTGAGVHVIVRNATLHGPCSFTASGTGAGSAAKLITIDFHGVEQSLSTHSMLFSGCSGTLQHCRLQNTIISAATVDGFLTSGTLFSQVIGLITSHLTLDATAGGFPGGSFWGGMVQTGTWFKGSGANMSAITHFIGNNASITGTLTSGSNIITAASAVPSTVIPTGGQMTAGIPITGPGIPAGTLTGTSPGAGQIAMVDAAGNPVNATASLVAARLYHQSQLNFSAGAARTQLVGGTLNRQIYIPTTAADWQVVPATALQALDYLAARFADPVADIATPASATAEDVANKLNALMAALRASNQLKP